MTQNPILHSDGLPPFPENLPENDKAADKIVDIHSISEQNSPENVTFKRLDNRMELFNLKFNKKNWYSRSSQMY